MTEDTEIKTRRVLVHKALGDVTPADVLHGRREQILQRRKEVQIQTVNHRRDYNQAEKELVHTA
jgi:hypothetical protein